MKESSTALSYIRLYADAQGVSHFVDETYDLRGPAGAGGEAALPILRLENAQGASFIALKRDRVEDWHLAPRRQFLIVLRGAVEVTVSDGEVRRLKPSDILLVEDTTGKGHITRSVGTEDHVVVAIPVPTAGTAHNNTNQKGS
jgi:quercetin dioxygenase-like cupin family protein